MQIMCVLHKLILSTSKMDEMAKQDVHWWKETGFILYDYSFKGRELSSIRISVKSFLTFQCDVGCIPHQSVYGKQRMVFNLCMNHGLCIVN